MGINLISALSRNLGSLEIAAITAGKSKSAAEQATITGGRTRTIKFYVPRETILLAAVQRNNCNKSSVRKVILCDKIEDIDVFFWMKNLD